MREVQGNDWAAAFGKHLAAVEVGQERLRETLHGMRDAMLSGDAAWIERLLREEERLTAAFEELADARRMLLTQAAVGGIRAGSLAELAAAIGLPADFRDRIEAARGAAVELAECNATQRLVAHRTARHYADLLDLIASTGRQPEAYGQREATGGGLLDAAA